jgi:hypothetical protein
VTQLPFLGSPTPILTLHNPFKENIYTQRVLWNQQLTNSLKQSPSWEANRFSDTQISSTLWKPKLYYRIQKGLSLVYFFSQMNPVHTVSLLFRFILISCYYLRILLQVVFRFKIFLPKSFVNVYFLSQVPLDSPMFTFLSSSPWLYLAKEERIWRFLLFVSSLLLYSLSQVRIFNPNQCLERPVGERCVEELWFCIVTVARNT